MDIRLSKRVRAHFGVERNNCSCGELASGFRGCKALLPDFSYPPAPQFSDAGSLLSKNEFKALVSPEHRRRGVLLMRPLSSQSGGRSHGMAFCRLRNQQEQALAGDPCDFLEIDSVFFHSADWVPHAAAVTRNFATLFASQAEKKHLGPATEHGPSRMAYDLPVLSLPRIRDCPSESYAILDALAVGRRAVFGLESFVKDQDFFRACASAIAMLPPALRTDISIAAGFTTTVPDALIQWVDGYVVPPKPGALAVEISSLPPETRADDVGIRLLGRLVDDEIPPGSPADGGIDGDPFGDCARRRLALTLSRFSARQHNSVSPDIRATAALWQVVVDAVSCKQRCITAELAHSLASRLDRLFEEAHEFGDRELAFSTSHSGRVIKTLLNRQSFSASDPAAIADSVSAIEETLALGKIIASGHRWTSGLTALTRAAIGALRKVSMEKSATDLNVNASFLRAMARARHCSGILATLVEAEDVAVKRGVQQAVNATPALSPDIDQIRDDVVRNILNPRAGKEKSPVAILTGQSALASLSFR